MVNMLNPKNWIWVPFLSTGLVLLLLVCPGHAAQLKDIRVGEYKNFTRIVFELDAPAASEKIELRSAKRLAVVLDNTSTDLIRKIPVERSPHITTLQILERGNRLTALLAFDFDGFDHQSFSLIDPPRLVLDIHPTPQVPDAEAEPPESSPTLAQESENGALQTASDSRSEPASQPDAEVVSEKSAVQAPEPPPEESHKPRESVDRNSSPATPPTSANHSSNTRPGRLQFYLVIALVAITIVILALLLLMLLARHRWIDDESDIVATEEEPENPKKT
jgi:hypothetical protein